MDAVVPPHADRNHSVVVRHRHEGLLSLLYKSGNAAIRPTGVGRSPDGQPGLINFLRTPTPSLVAVTQGGNFVGDICHEEDKHVEQTPSRGTRPGSSGRLNMNPFGGVVDLTGTKGQCSEPEAATLDASETEMSDVFPPLPVPEGIEANLIPLNDTQGKPLGATRQGPWWRELLSSPVKRLCRSNWNNPFRTRGVPSFHLPPPSEETDTVPTPNATFNGKRRRKDIPDSKRRNVRNIPKAGLRGAVAWAKSKNARDQAVKNLERAFYANSSRVAKSSKRKTILDILNAAKESYPLTPFSIKLIAATLKEAGYKSAYTYLIEAKSYHLEQGFEWTHSLDRWFKLSINASKRGMGPRKKAKEVPEDAWANFSILPDHFDRKLKVRLPMHLFAVGVHWMLQEIEVAALSSNDIKLDCTNRMVSLTLTESKMDTAARGVSRTMQCICTDACDLRCPYAVMEVLVNHAALKGAPNGLLATSIKNEEVTKAELIKDWNTLYGTGITGHSARRSGALQYIRKGWAIAQVGYLGRWKSSIILEYAQEALESMALNVDKKFGSNELVKSTEQIDVEMNKLVPAPFTPAPKEQEISLAMVNKLEAELKDFKENTTEAKCKLQAAIKELNVKFDGSVKYLPRLVKSHRNQVVHLNTKALVYAPSHLWRTVCGWHYYNSTYEFLAGDTNMITCHKCNAAAQGKEVTDAA